MMRARPTRLSAHPLHVGRAGGVLGRPREPVRIDGDRERAGPAATAEGRERAVGRRFAARLVGRACLEKARRSLGV